MPLIESVDICHGNVQWMDRVSFISEKRFTVERYDEIDSGYSVAAEVIPTIFRSGSHARNE